MHPPGAAWRVVTAAGFASPRTREDATSMNDNLSVTDLVTRARNGDKQAWDGLVEGYAPLVWSICRRNLAALRTQQQRALGCRS